MGGSAIISGGDDFSSSGGGTDEEDLDDDIYNDDDANNSDSLLADPSPNDMTVEESLSKELLKLSVSDRNELEEEIHGVRCMAIAENSDLIRSKLKEFNALLVEYVLANNKNTKNKSKGKKKFRKHDCK